MSTDWPLILTYHHISTAEKSRYVIPVSLFERQVHEMLEAGFTPITIDEALATGPHGDGTAAPKTFTLTFDDALVSFTRLAVPAMERLGVLHAACSFVPTKHIGAENAWRTEPTLLQRIMPWSEIAEEISSWEEIEQLVAKGVRIESHGHAHAPMNKMTYAQAREDIETSLQLMRAHGIEPRYMAWPYGWHSEDAKRAVADAGLEAAISVKWGGRDIYEVRRIPVYGTDSALTWKLKLSGRYFDVFDFAARVAGKKRYAR